jgi:hypothetical protein
VALSLIFDILVASRVHNVDDPDGPEIAEEYKHPHNEDSDCESVADEENGLVLEFFANRDCSNDESSIGKDHGPPSEMEVLGS